MGKLARIFHLSASHSRSLVATLPTVAALRSLGFADANPSLTG